MNVPESLPYQLYLLAYDTGRERMTARLELGYLLRAGALTELLLTGLVSDVRGKPQVRTGAVTGDPVLEPLLAQIAASRPRSWQHWIGWRQGRASREVRDALADAGVVRLERGRALGLFPVTRVRVPDRRAVGTLADRVTDALNETRPVTRVEARDAALVSLAAHAELHTVLPRARRRRHRRRIAALGEPAEPVGRALRKALANARAAASGTT